MLKLVSFLLNQEWLITDIFYYQVVSMSLFYKNSKDELKSLKGNKKPTYNDSKKDKSLEQFFKATNISKEEQEKFLSEIIDDYCNEGVDRELIKWEYELGYFTINELVQGNIVSEEQLRKAFDLFYDENIDYLEDNETVSVQLLTKGKIEND